MTKLTVAVFSYNRSEYLAYCLASIERNMPQARVVVYDDLSDDPETAAFLSNLSVPVVQPTLVEKARHGGLYTNMATAFAEVDTDYLMFLQDDMQIVRPVESSDIDALDMIFASDPDCGFVSPQFMKAGLTAKLLAHYRADPDLRAYVFSNEISREAMGFAFSDVCIAHVPRLRAAGFAILQGEDKNEMLAKSLFSHMPWMADPFAFYCPEVPTFRNRKLQLSGQIAKMIRRPAGLGFHDMKQTDVKKLRARDLSVWPFAEDFLTAENPNVRKPFVFRDFHGPLGLRILSKIESLLVSGGRRLRGIRKKLGR